MSGVALVPKGEKRPYVMRKGISRLDDLVDGMAMANVALAGAKTIFYADLNYGSDNQSGVGGWGNAKGSLTAALAASHADIASGPEGFAARNVILCKGDAFVEDLELLAQKTDVIGVGSYDSRSQPGLIGNHVPVGSTCSFGTRFFNFWFRAPAAGGDIWTLDGDTARIEFHGCTFDASSTAAADDALDVTDVEHMGIFNCLFLGPFAAACISIKAGEAGGTRIVGNDMTSGAVGILMASSVTVVEGSFKILDNDIVAVTLCVDDDSSVAKCNGNRCLSDADSGTNGLDIMDINIDYALDNWISGSDLNNTAMPAIGTLGGS